MIFESLKSLCPPEFLRAEHLGKISFSFLKEKISRAQIRNSKQNFSVVWRELASGGGAASLVPFKVGSSNVQNFPQFKTFQLFRWGQDRM
ncbi:MAG: hypothetical protein AAB939_00455 [Patescibacteria group bacterium]